MNPSSLRYLHLFLSPHAGGGGAEASGALPVRGQRVPCTPQAGVRGRGRLRQPPVARARAAACFLQCHQRPPEPKTDYVWSCGQCGRVAGGVPRHGTLMAWAGKDIDRARGDINTLVQQSVD